MNSPWSYSLIGNQNWIYRPFFTQIRASYKVMYCSFYIKQHRSAHDVLIKKNNLLDKFQHYYIFSPSQICFALS